MASTDLDGSKIVILSEADARIILELIHTIGVLEFTTEEEEVLRQKIERALED